MTEFHAIGKAADISGVKVTTIRYYEEIGLMPAPVRRNSGRRVYDDHAVGRLQFIRHARDLGFSVDSIRGLIELQQDPGTDCARADQLARHHLDETRARISQLQQLETELVRMIDSCRGGAVARCEIIASLSDHSRCRGEHGQT